MSVSFEKTVNYKLNNTTFQVSYGDITKLQVDAIVSSDDSYLSMGGGVSYAIRKAGGECIYQDCQKHTPLKVGDVVVTGTGNLYAKYVFHTVTLDYSGKNVEYPSEKTIKAAVTRCMQLADVLDVKTIAFPALGAGTAGFPYQLAAEIMIRTVTEYLLNQTSINLVVISLFSKKRLVKESNLNLFYERAAAHATAFTLSKRLH